MDILIQKAAPDDLKFCHHLTELEDWNYSYEEISTLYFTPGATFFIARDERPIGMVATFRYGLMAWLGLLIVSEDVRKRGIGTMLLEKALYHEKSHGVTTIRLEAVQDAVSLYENLGFTPEFKSLRMKGKGDGNYREYDKIPSKIVENIVVFDAPYFGASRYHFLKRCFTLSPITLVNRNPAITGYLMARHATTCKIGPCVAENEEIFTQLLESVLSQIGGSITIGIPACNGEGIDVLKHYGFTIASVSVRMVWGKQEFGGNPKKIFAIGGPEKG